MFQILGLKQLFIMLVYKMYLLQKIRISVEKICVCYDIANQLFICMELSKIATDRSKLSFAWINCVPRRENDLPINMVWCPYLWHTLSKLRTHLNKLFIIDNGSFTNNKLIKQNYCILIDRNDKHQAGYCLQFYTTAWLEQYIIKFNTIFVRIR